jgi:hypothetical protein
MDGVLIATTRNADLQSLGTGGQRAVHVWDQLVGYVRRRFGAPHAALFAEPNPDPDRGTIDWYADGAGAIRLDALPEPQQAGVRAELERLLGELSAESERQRKSTREDERFLGEMLGLALVTPGADYIYVVEGRPVLVAWGHTRIGEAVRPELLIAPRTLTPRRASPESRRIAPMAIVGPPVEPRRFPLGLLLSSALLSLLILMLVPLLVFSDPLGWFRLPPAQCTIPPAEAALQEELRNEQRREGQMRSEIARISLALGDRRTKCPPVPGPGPVRPGPGGQAGIPEYQRELDRQRAEREGGKSGRIQVILAWDDTSDLDLAVVCPGGSKIDFDTPSSCNGTLDVDRNAHSPTTNPVENIVFEREPPTGRYEIYVTHYKLGPSAPPTSPFRVTVRQEGQPDRSFTGVLAPQRRVHVGSFDVPAGR